MQLDVVSLLDEAGVQNLREGDKEIAGSCPMHRERIGHADRHSSWSINRHSLVHHCFSCGYSGTLTGLLIDIQGYAPDNIEAAIAKTSFLRTMDKVERRFIAPENPIVTEWQLTHTLVAVPERLVVFRQLHTDAVATFGIRWDPKERSWVLPIRTPEGTLMGAQYRQKGVVLNRPDGMEKSVTLFGLPEMMHYNRVTLVESPLDAVRLFGLGIPAVSSFGAWVSPQQVQLLARNFGTVVLAMDNDAAGRQAMAHTAQQLRRRGTAAVPYRYDGLRDGNGRKAKDVGDVELDEHIVRNYQMSMSSQTFIPPPPKKKVR